MGRKIRVSSSQVGRKAEFVKIFRELCYARQYWQVWSDLVSVMACSIANAVDRHPERHSSREKEYADCIKRLGGVEKPAQLFVILVEELESNPDQDFLGALYMELQLGNHWKGQFFTPYNVSRMMAEMTVGNCENEIEDKGFITLCDPCVGGGAMLIAGTNAMRRQNINYQTNALFAGQDIDRIVGMMAYIQISLLGCPGYIVIADSLRYPLCGSALMPQEKTEQEFWYTPFYFSEIWNTRRSLEFLKMLMITEKKEVKGNEVFFTYLWPEKENYMPEKNMNLFSDLDEFNEAAKQLKTDGSLDELRDMAKEQGVSSDDIEKYISGEIDMLVSEEIVKAQSRRSEQTSFASGADKLKSEQDECLSVVEEQYREMAKKQYDMVFAVLINKCKTDAAFDAKVLQEHKCWNRCMKFCSEKALKICNPTEDQKAQARSGRQPIATPVDSITLFKWIEEYYAVDDKAELEKEKKAEAKRKEREKNQTAEKKETNQKKAEAVKQKEEKPKRQSKSKEQAGQMNLFDLM